jgi:branched-subunit amino acid transport protein
MDTLMAYLNVWGFADWNPWTFITILLMACVTVITRSFFFISDAPWTLPSWAQRAMQYAPIAALAAVVLPEIVMTQGSLIHSMADARIYGAIAGATYFFWRRESSQAVLGTIVAGMLVYLPLHVVFHW